MRGQPHKKRVTDRKSLDAYGNGALVHYHKFWDNFIMEIEDGTGQMQVLLPRPQCLECSGAVELHRECTINSYVCVIGMVADDFNIQTIIASDVWPVSSGNKITYHMLEVAYSADKIMKHMEEKFDAELMAVDLDQIIREYHSTINKKRKSRTCR
jgi:hypothetical protein